MANKLFYPRTNYHNILLDRTISNRNRAKISVSKNLKDHVLLGEGCAKGSAWKQKHSGAALFFCLFLLIALILQAVLCSAQGQIALDKSQYGLGETVKIRLINTSPDYSLNIISDNDVFRYSGELKEEMDFYPTKEEQYTVRLNDPDNNILLDEKTFNVSSDYIISKPALLYTDKKEYSLNEVVQIFVNTSSEGGSATEQELRIISEKESLKYLGAIDSPISFLPRYVGAYQLKLINQFVPVATAEFLVLNQTTNETAAVIPVQSEARATENKSTEKNQTEAGILEQQSAAQAQQGLEATGIDDQLLPTEEQELLTPRGLNITLPFRLELKASRGAAADIMNSISILRAEGIRYDVEYLPGKANIKSIVFNNLRLDGNKSFEFDEIILKKEESRKELGDMKIMKSFFIDTAQLNYTNGTITATALGKELWKCKEWNPTMEACLGSWVKVQDLIPGREYYIMITPEDPAYAETGVASINTKKPVYHPNETAEIIMVVLDTKGRLVSNAQVTLAITAPDSTTTILTTTNQGIKETNRGIYEAAYNKTWLEGNYSLFVTAMGWNVNYSMQSNFEVREFYEFDIIRQTPVTIDPWQGPFQSRIRLIPFINTTSYDFTEILPSEFVVTDSGGAQQKTIGNQTFLTWTNLNGTDLVGYEANAPLITPNLYALGRSFITYFAQGTTMLFTEARNWFLAIDPLQNLFFDDFESGWGCRTTGAPAAGNNCSVLGWGEFTNCYTLSAARFCTSDDGKEGNHTTYYAIQMTNWIMNSSAGLWYTLDPSPYDDINVNGYIYGASLDNVREYCVIWSRDSNSIAPIYNCTNTICTGTDTTPQTDLYIYFNVNLSSLSGINLSESNISVHIGGAHSNTADYCFFDRINITAIAYPPTITNLTNPPNNTVTNLTTIQFNFTVNATRDSVLPNCTLWTNINGSWMANSTRYNVSRNNITNITIAEAPDRTFKWNIICYTRAGLYDWYDSNFTLTIDARPPIKTITSIDEDTSEPWNTTNRNPVINLSLNKNGTCRLSTTDSNFTSIPSYYNCTGAKTTNISCTYSGAQLSIGTNYLYIACNDTSGHNDNTTSNLDITFEVLCDSHTDCDSTSYCDYTQYCHSDELPGYPCNTQAHTGLAWNEVCGNGTNKYCVNDSSYSYTGWYCTGSATDCVYNDQGKSYALGETLCISGLNDYRNCSISNLWSSQVNCAEQFDAHNQSATYHPGLYCGYYGADQSCVNGTTGGCSGASTACNPYIYNQTITACGSTLEECDFGCGAGCDAGNSTAPGITSGTCYYNKNCDINCLWSQSQEEAPLFCINDNDGGTCSYNNRTNPSIQDTCYWNASCQNTVGATLNNNSILRANYCDYCNQYGNQTGQYSPTPNTSCSSNCENSGTIYYDSVGTPADRSNDCSNGITTILSDTLAIGDIWNGSAPATCNNTECNLDCGTMVGTCSAGVCNCTDQDNPKLIIISPEAGAWDNDGTVLFTYNITDISSGISNCSLILNSNVNMTNITINESLPEQTFTKTLADGVYNWAVICFDNSTQHHQNQSEERIIGIDTVQPLISSPATSGTSFSINQQICLNASASDINSGINRVYALIRLPDASFEEVDLYDTATTSCDSSNGDGIYSVAYNLIFSGTYTFTYAYAIDNANNHNNASSGSSWNVSAGGNMTTTMTYPAANMTINESEANNFFNQSCGVICLNGSAHCLDVSIYPQYYDSYESGEWQNINDTTPLQTTTANYSCGNLSASNSASWWNSSWAYRRRLTVTNSNNTQDVTVNYSIKIIMDTTGSEMMDDGSDIRIVYWNGTANSEIDRVNRTAFNSATTDIWFAVQKSITAAASDSNYYIYFGNTTASAAPSDYNKVFRYFNPGNSTTSWTAYGTGTILSVNPGGYLNLTATANNYNTAGVYYSGLTIDNLEYSLEFYIQSGEYMMMYARGTTGNTYYSQFLDINDAVLTANHIRFINAGTATNLVENDVITNDIALSTWHNASLQISGSSIRSYYDGILESSTTNSTLTSGRIGLHDQVGIFRVRNIRVRNLMSPEPTAVIWTPESYPPSISCDYTFNITAQPDAGNHTYPIRCKSSSSNSATVFSSAKNITVNDHPNPSISFPYNNTWLNSVININASASYDSDGSITNYTFTYDNNTAFSSPSTICNGTSNNCTWNTTAQNQCNNNSLSCYLRVTVTDNDRLTNSTYITVGFDTQGPTTIIGNPQNFTNITTSQYSVNATVTDNEIGIINMVIFEYRENNTASWKQACNDSDRAAPYVCSWNITALLDGKTYEVRAYSTDILNNTGGADTRTNITIDRNGPTINLESPTNNTYNIGNQTFYFNITDTASNINNCSIMLDGSINQTTDNPQQGVSLNFTINDNTAGSHTWRIDCTDTVGNINSSETRTFTVDLTGPTTILNRPPAADAKMYGVYLVNASATDSGVGNISSVSFEYRETSTAEWVSICNATQGPAYNCSLDTTALADGTTYEVRAYATDILNNTGLPSVRYSVTIDNNGPAIDGLSPESGTVDNDGNVTFSYRVDDVGSGVANCSLIINGSTNQTSFAIPEGIEQYFYLYNQNDTSLNWSITCWDDFTVQPHMTQTDPRTLYILILFVLKENVTTNQRTYETGNQQSENINITTTTIDYSNESIDASAITDIIKTADESMNIWWNTTWRYRLRNTIIETSSKTRKDQWTHLSFMLDPDCDNLAHKNSLRLLQDSGTNIGFNQWNITYCTDTNYIKSLWISFRLNLTANTNTNIYLYYDNASTFTKTSKDQGPMRMIWVSTGGTGNAPLQNTIKTDLNSALSAIGLDSNTFYDNLNTTAASADFTLTNMQNYSIIYYDSAAKYSSSWYSAEANSLFQFVNQSGSLFLTGQELGYQANTDGWLYNAVFTNLTHVSAGYVDNAGPTTFTVAANHQTTKYLGMGTTVSVTGDYEDGYTTLAGSTSVRIINWTGSATPTAGTANDGLNDPSCTGFCGKTVYYSGLFYISATQGIQNTTARSGLLRGTIEWFLNNSLAESIGQQEQWIARNTTNTTGTQGLWSWIYSAANMNGSYQAVSQASKPKYNNATNWTGFNVTTDRTPPNITLNGPQNGSEANSSVTFSYYVNDTLSTVLNCSLIIDGNEDDSDPTIQEGVIQYFYPRIPTGGWHNWSVNCTDYYENVGASEKWTIFIKPPDLTVSSNDIAFNNTTPREGDNVTIIATIYNTGGSDAENVKIQFYLGDPDAGGTQINGNFTANITDINGAQPNATFNVSWVTTGPGPFRIYIAADPPTSTNGTIFESNETNNKAYNTLNVPAYNHFYGLVKNNVYLSDENNNSLFYYLNITNVTGNIFAIDGRSTVDFSALQSIGRDINNNTAANDFNDTDTALNMSGYNDSIRRTYTADTDTPLATKTFTFYTRTAQNTPIVNSTNTSNFQTGILWDTNDGGTQYNGTQDIAFITEINQNKTGAYGTYDYEIKVPVNLKNYEGPGNSIVFYWEIKEP